MIVLGCTISDDMQARCWTALPDQFSVGDVQRTLSDLGMPNSTSLDTQDSPTWRGAERLIQQWRKASQVVCRNRLWIKVGA